MKHARIFLLLTLVLMLCRCSKQNESGTNASIEKSQLSPARLKNSDIFAVDQKDSVKSISPIPSKFFDEVTELLKPVQENLDQIFKKMNPDLYESYQKDLETISGLKSDEERSKLAESMKNKYYAFLKEGWINVGIDDKAYQEKITNLLPDELRKLIRFNDDFLNFYFDILKPPGSTVWLPRMKDDNNFPPDRYPDPPTPPTPPAPPCTTVEGATYTPGITASNSWVNKVLCADAYSYPLSSSAIYAHAYSWPPIWGHGIGSIDLVGNKTPPNNGCTKVRVRKTIIWSANMYAFTFYGHLTVATAEYNSGQTAGNMTVVAPVLWFHERKGSTVITENYIISKSDFRTKFGANLKATVFSEGVFSHGSSRSSLSIPSWTLTDICCK